jgi:starch synthase
LRADPAAWRRLMARGMAQELSWAGPAERYAALYEEALSRRRAKGLQD